MKPFSWSYSQLGAFEICPKRHYHYNVAKDVVEPENDAMREGNELHKAFELRVRRAEPLPLGMGMHEPLLAKIAALPGKKFAEMKLALNAEFQPTGYFADDVWFRTVVDLAVADYPTVRIFDWKTGKFKEDPTQLQLMTAAVFAGTPRAERAKTALVFVGQKQTYQQEFTRADLPAIWAGILPRVNKMKAARETKTYPPTPGGLCKKYCAVASCPYHRRGV